jgi:hypothetical protein
MDTQNTALVPQDDWYAIIDLVTQSVDSPHSKRAYSRALIDFLDWYEGNGRGRWLSSGVETDPNHAANGSASGRNHAGSGTAGRSF